MGIGIYVHVPFCISKCAYCDFYSLPKACHDASLKERYVDALVRQLQEAAELYGNLTVSTVFIGGGTPTVLETEQLLRIIGALKSAFDLTPDFEFTVEANPATFDEQKLTAMKAAGVNRISIGIQSAINSELEALGRIHSFEEAKSAFELTRSCAFDNISVDIMYGIPSQTRESFLKTIDEVCSLSPDHISAYGLQLEEGTPLWKSINSLEFPTENECVEMYSAAIKILENHGYGRYEISNFAKKGRECRHNLGYWSGGEYLGFGAGAYSYFDSKRFHVEGDASAFCSAQDFSPLITIDEQLSDGDKVTEFIMLSLRLTQGFSTKELFDRTLNADFYLERCEKFIRSGLMKSENGRIFFTEKGFNVSNAILSEILFD